MKKIISYILLVLGLLWLTLAIIALLPILVLPKSAIWATGLLALMPLGVASYFPAALDVLPTQWR